ncbi:hypothetical protein JCM10449v2_004747 [Rhodotorula kratochvilovae]
MPAHPALQPGNIAVITGAGAGGIGFAVASLLASRFYMFPILLDIDRAALDEASMQLVASGVPEDKFETRVVDVTDPQDLLDAADAIFAKHGRVDFLHLNAGIAGKSRTYGAGMLEDWDRIFKVNLGGVTAGSAAFVERMVAQDSPAAVVITGSKQGMTNPPGTGAAYNASKTAVKAFAEVLAHDLLLTQITVKLLIPGWVYSKLSTGGAPVDNASKPAGAWTTEQCAEELFARIGGDEFYILCPDNETSAELDLARLAWSADDPQKGRPALSRWNPAYKEEYERFIEEKVGK